MLCYKWFGSGVYMFMSHISDLWRISVYLVKLSGWGVAVVAYLNPIITGGRYPLSLPPVESLGHSWGFRNLPVWAKVVSCIRAKTATPCMTWHECDTTRNTPIQVMKRCVHFRVSQWKINMIYGDKNANVCCFSLLISSACCKDKRFLRRHFGLCIFSIVWHYVNGGVWYRRSFD